MDRSEYLPTFDALKRLRMNAGKATWNNAAFCSAHGIEGIPEMGYNGRILEHKRKDRDLIGRSDSKVMRKL